VGSAFRAQNSPPSVTILPDLLAQVPIVLFSGAEDLICNHLGTEALISNLQWNGGKGFEVTPGNMAPRRDWTFEGQPAGFWQEARNLTYVLFYNSSHMVLFDFARRSRDMLDRFMGVDISSIGGAPTNSRLDGEKGPATTVGDAAHPSSGMTGGDDDLDETNEDEETQKKLQKAKWQAYRKSGEVVLVIVAVAAAVWGYFVWRDRRRRKGYQGLGVQLPTGGAMSGSRRGGLENFRNKRNGRAGDVEAGDFDESELDDLHVATPTDAAASADRDRYSVGGDSEDDDEDHPEKKHGHGGAANGGRS
jgi:carboxypeptidase D